MALTTDQFRDHLIASGLLSPEDLSLFLNSLSAEKQPQDGEQLARELVRQKKLTKYQAEQIYGGRGKTLVLGNYVILDKLGQGGMGVVLKAEHKRLKRLVALKVMSASVVRTPDALKRFHREVEAAAKLRHNNVVATDDADEAKGTHFLVMEYVEGSDLSALVKKNGPLSVSQSLQCILQAARGLEFAHSQGIVHRDIKPANLLLDSKGTVKILDMGLARIEGDPGSQGELTTTGAVMGTVDYMAPEQALSTKHADARSDIYSLGISLWYLLTGKCAYEGDSLMSKLLAHRDAPIPSLCRVDPDIPASVDAVFRKMVAKQGKDRFQSMTEVIRELEYCLNGSSTVSNVSMPSSFDDSSLQSFLSKLDGSPSATAATREITFPATGVNVNSASEATILNGSIDVSTDPQTMASVRIQEAIAKPGRGLKASQAVAPLRSRNLRILLGGGAAAILVMIAVIVLIRTPHGTLRVEIHDPEVEMKVKGTELKFYSTNSDPISLTAGDKKLIVMRGDLSFETETFTLRKGTETLVKVELIGDKLTVRDGNNIIAEQSIHPDTSTAFATAKDPGTTNLQTGVTTVAVREALEWLFSMEATVLVGEEGSVVQVRDIADVVARGKPVVSISLDQRLVSDEELVRLTKFPAIYSLRLTDCMAIADGGMRHLAELPVLSSLILSGTRVGDQGLLALRKCSRLRQLHLNGTRVTGAGLAALSQFSQMNDLDLGRLQISDASLVELQKLSMLGALAVNNCERLTENCGAILGKFPALHTLNMEGTSLGDHGVEGLSASSTLQYLNLNGTKLTDAAVPGLGRLSSLIALSVRGTAISPEGIARLVSSLPNCDIDSDHGTFKSSGQNALATISALEFDGVSSHVELPLFPLDGTGPLTIEAWFTAQPGDKPNANDVDAKTDAIWSLQNPQSKAVANYILDRANGGWWFGAGVERLLETVYYSFTRTDKRTDLYNVRHHAAFVRDGDDVRLYVDGIPLRSGGTTVDFDKTPLDPPATFQTVDKFFLGAATSLRDGSSLTRFFHGSLDELRVSRIVRYTKPFTPKPIFSSDEGTVALYHFDEGQGDVLTDSSGNNHHGRIVGAKWGTVPDDVKPVYPLEFDGQDDYVAIDPPVGLLSAPLTIEVICTPARTDTYQPIVTMLDKESISLFVGFNGVAVTMTDATRNYQQFHRYNSSDEVHLAVIHEGGWPSLFVDGKLSGERRTFPPDAAFKADRSWLRIGAYGADLPMAGYFTGQIKQVRISRGVRYLTDTTPVRYFTKDANTLALYRFDEGQGDQLKDSSGNNHHGRIVGARWMHGEESSAVIDSPDRRAAEWVLAQLGEVTVNGRKGWITSVKDLPASEFQLQLARLTLPLSGENADLVPLRELQHLVFVGLDNARPTPVGIAELTRLPKLERISCGGKPLSDEHVTAFGQLTNVTEVFISGVSLTPAQCATLVTLMPQLASINLSNNNLLDDSALTPLGDLKKLRKLQLQGTQVTAAGVAALQKALPECLIEWNDASK